MHLDVFDINANVKVSVHQLIVIWSLTPIQQWVFWTYAGNFAFLHPLHISSVSAMCVHQGKH